MRTINNIGLYIHIVILLFFTEQSIILASQNNNHQPTIKAGVYDNPPKIFINEYGDPDGIFIDVIKSLAKKENLHIEYVQGEWIQLITMLANGEIDVLPDVAYSKERDTLFTLSTLSLLGSWLEVYTTGAVKINSVLDLQNKKIGVLKGSIQEKYLNTVAKNTFNINFETIAYNDYTNSVLSLKDHEIDVIVADRFFYFSELCDKEIHPTGIILRPTELHFAFTKNKDPELVKMFDKHISMQKNKAKSDYYRSLQRWLDKNYPTDIPRYIIGLLVIIGLVMLIVSVFALLLQYKVKAKTRILRLRNEELIVAKEKAEESNRLKTVFLQNLSHEIRTPMNGIIGFIGILQESRLNTESRNKYIDMVKKSSNRLLYTLDNIIEISKIESKQIAISYSETDVMEEMTSCFNSFRKPAEEKGLSIKLLNKNKNEKIIIKTDKSVLNRILFILIHNAIKFTHEGMVELGYNIKDNNIEFYVKDTGIGIPDNRFEAIFERFVQADINNTRLHEGSGLGLSIAKAYAEMLNGMIRVTSEIGKGSTFFFSLPLKPDN